MHPQDTTPPTRLQAKREYQREYYRRNKDRAVAYRQQHKEQIAGHQATYAKAWYQRNKEHVLARVRAYGQRNKERIAARSKEHYQCNKETIATRAMAYRRANKETIAASRKRKYDEDRKAGIPTYRAAYYAEVYPRLRTELLAAYGGKCACCGEVEPAFLQLDHVNGGGTKDKEKSGGLRTLYGRLKREGWPEGYQILCANCNYAKAFPTGGCPHQSEAPKSGASSLLLTR